MNKSKVSVFFDSLFITTLSCLLLYVWINKYLKNANLSFFICIFICLLLFYCVFKNQNNKYNLNKIKLHDEKTIRNISNYFTYSSATDDKIFFTNLFKCNQIDYNIYKKDNLIIYINLKTHLSENDFFTAHSTYLNYNNDVNLIFICKNHTDRFKELLDNSPIKFNVYYLSDLYFIIKENNTFPPTFENNNKFKHLTNFKQKAITSLTKNHFFKFLFSGIALITLSVFIPYTFYYLFFGTILLIFSIICLFNKNKPKLNQTEPLKSLLKKTDA